MFFTYINNKIKLSHTHILCKNENKKCSKTIPQKTMFFTYINNKIKLSHTHILCKNENKKNAHFFIFSPLKYFWEFFLHIYVSKILKC